MDTLINTDPNNLLIALGISIAIQIFFFTFAASFKSDKVTDLSYGLTFVIMSGILLVLNPASTPPQILLFAMIAAWGIRLAGYLFIRILKIKTDKRFDGIRESFKRFAMFWTFQGISIWVIMLPAVIFFSKPAEQVGEFSALSAIGFIIWLVGLFVETVADAQKFSFKNNQANQGKWIESGLWKYSRHPNYFGEMLCWWGIFIFVLPGLVGLQLLTIIGPLFIVGLLLFGTGIPTLERKYDKRYADNQDYQRYKNSTPLLVPFTKF